MSAFTGPLSVTFENALFGIATLNENLRWECDHLGSQRFVDIPIGFRSDGITSPRILWWLVPPWGSQASRAAMLHDYALVCLLKEKPHPELDNLNKINKEFYIALLACEINPVLSRVMWLFVHLHHYKQLESRKQWLRRICS